MPSNPRLHLHDEPELDRAERNAAATSCLLDSPAELSRAGRDAFTIAPGTSAQPQTSPDRHGSLEEREDAPAGASIFAIGRRGELKWCTPSAQRDLKQIGARHPRRPGRLTPEWAFLLWKPIHPHRLEYQIAPLDAESLPCRGRVAWSPRRPLELTVSIWRLRASSVEPDPTWRRLMRELRGDQPDGDDGRPAA